ncbi:Hypp8034 [Branchiostoma lanceolatum]|uniref:Hypp8034 protein n=2 Tax=Branchiostoma lanceolatum TaxID=7740 RepID=A0A8J9Z6B8_BRALA|nr:Hypp8034 [Branchiostoma lanceolatum]
MAKCTFHFRGYNSELAAFGLLLLLTMAAVGDSNPIPPTTTRSAGTERRTACEQLDENVRIVHRLFLTTEKFFKHFNELRFGNPEYSNRDLTLRGLPELSTSFTDWESLTSEVRLTTMRHNLHQLYPFLDVLEVDEGEAVVREAGRLEEKLSRQLQNVLSHTRSLMRAISTTMHLMEIENDETDNATPAPVHLSETPSEYDRSLRDHIIVRDFVDFLRRVQRDFMKLRYNNGCRRTTRSPTHTGRRS